MKRFFCLALFLTGFMVPRAQNCTDFFFLQDNKTVEMTTTNKKGKETGKMTYSVSNVIKSGSSVSSIVAMETFDTKGKSVSKAINNVKCADGVMMMDMKMFIPSAQQEQMGTAAASASDVYLEYPPSMKEGDMLKDGQFNMDFKMQSGMGGSVSVNITNRKVHGRESVTTAAGTWDCFKITYKSRIVMKLIVGIPINVEATEWYAPGIGVVKTETSGGKTEITAIK